MQFRFLLGLEGHTELELFVVHEAETGRPDFGLRDVVHELYSHVKIMEKEGFVDLLLRDRSHLYRAFCDNAKVSLVAQDELVDVWTRADSWRILNFLEGADRCCNLDSDNDIIDVSISILLHARCTSTDPPSKRAKLHRIGLMSDHHSKFAQFLLHILADDACLDTSDHIALINPLNLVHPGHINRYNSPFLVLLTHQRFSDIGTSSEWDQHNIMLLCCLNQVLGLLVRGDIDHIINSPWQFAETQHEEFFERVAVRVEDTGHFIGVYLVYLTLYLLNEEEIFDWWVDWDISLRLDRVAGVDADDRLDPILELGHLLT